MKFVKDISLVALGVGATLAYQKYGQCAIDSMSKATNKMMKQVTNKLEDMM